MHYLEVDAKHKSQKQRSAISNSGKKPRSRRLGTLGLALQLALVVSAHAQLPNAPVAKDPDRFLSTQHLLLFNSSAVSLAASAGEQCAPSAAILSHRQCNQQMIAAGSVFAFEVMGAALLHAHKRHGWETLVPVATTLFGTGRAAWVATHRRH